jgi:hypothetical protein
MVDSDAYKRTVTLIGLLAPVLADAVPDLAGLEAYAPTALAQVRDLASRRAISTADLDLDSLVDAALAQRLRTLQAEAGSSWADARVEQARAAGLAWASVSEPDPRSLGMSPSQEWVDVHIASRTRLVRTIGMDPATGSAVFTIALHSVDGPGVVLGCATRQEWLDEAEELRADVERAHPADPGAR